MTPRDEIFRLVEILAAEWRGERINRDEARSLAGQLLPRTPDLKHTLTRIYTRMG